MVSSLASEIDGLPGIFVSHESHTVLRLDMVHGSRGVVLFLM